MVKIPVDALLVIYSMAVWDKPVVRGRQARSFHSYITHRLAARVAMHETSGRLWWESDTFEEQAIAMTVKVANDRAMGVTHD